MVGTNIQALNKMEFKIVVSGHSGTMSSAHVIHMPSG